MTSPPTILIVEDEVSIADMYKFKLSREGFVVQTAENGQAGLEICTTQAPDLILLDLKMPVMSGDEMLQAVRQTPWGAEVKVIILTNISRDEAPHTLRLLHVDRYIVKAHHTPAQVLDVVKDVLGLKNLPNR